MSQKSRLSRGSLHRWIVLNETCLNISFCTLNTFWYDGIYQSISSYAAAVGYLYRVKVLYWWFHRKNLPKHSEINFQDPQIHQNKLHIILRFWSKYQLRTWKSNICADWWILCVKLKKKKPNTYKTCGVYSWYLFDISLQYLDWFHMFELYRMYNKKMYRHLM